MTAGSIRTARQPCTAPAQFPHACESGAGLKEERTYFGADPNGTPTTLWGPVQAWTLSPVSSGVYFFRLSAADNLNQATPVQTVRVLKLDTLAPTVVLTYTGSNPSVMNTMPLQWGGADALSGIATYDVLVNGAVWLSNTATSATYNGAATRPINSRCAPKTSRAMSDRRTRNPSRWCAIWCRRRSPSRCPPQIRSSAAHRSRSPASPVTTAA